VPGAFARYERILRPQTDRAQTFVIPRIGHPHAPWQRTLLRTGLRVLAGPAGTTLDRIRGHGAEPPVDTITLPDYPVPTPSRR
jgi:hypothetical protein